MGTLIQYWRIKEGFPVEVPKMNHKGWLQLSAPNGWVEWEVQYVHRGKKQYGAVRGIKSGSIGWAVTCSAEKCQERRLEDLDPKEPVCVHLIILSLGNLELLTWDYYVVIFHVCGLEYTWHISHCRLQGQEVCPSSKRWFELIQNVPYFCKS